MCSKISTSAKSLSTSYIGVRFGGTKKIAQLFSHKVREAMKPCENHAINGIVHVY